jgi:hypothetical protein
MAQFVAARAARDALYLSYLPTESLPAVVAGTAVLSLGIAGVGARTFRRMSPPHTLVMALCGMAALFLVERALFSLGPHLIAPLMYLQISVVGPMLGSTLWLITNERFDPRAARAVFTRMVAMGALGGLLGGVAAVGVATMWGAVAVLPLLAALSLAAAWQVRRFDASAPPARAGSGLDAALPSAATPTLLALARAPFLRNLAALVCLGAIASTLLDYALKSHAAAAWQQEDLVRFFALYYAAIAIGTFVVQTGAHRAALERLGLAGTVATPAVAVVVGGVGALFAPNLVATAVARGGEAVLRGSLFRSSYEIFFTPVSTGDKRVVKSMIDVVADRFGDAVGAGLIALVLVSPMAWQHRIVVTLAVASAVAAMWVARRLTGGYVDALERSLREKAVNLPLEDVRDRTTRTVLWHTLGPSRPDETRLSSWDTATSAAPPDSATGNAGAQTSEGSRSNVRTRFDVDVLQILALRSGDPVRIARVLDVRSPLAPALIAHAIALLEQPDVAAPAARALALVAHDHAGELVDALLDSRRPPAVRRRVARLLAARPSTRGVDGLLAALLDDRFDIREQCARSLARIREAHATLSVDAARIHAAVIREVSLGRRVWEGYRALADDETGQQSPLDEYVRERADRGLAHVFTLLSIVLPAEPLRIAYRGLYTDDPLLRGTALEYLESVLPPELRHALWPFLDDARPAGENRLPRSEVAVRLLQAHPSILINLQQRAARGTPRKEE